MTREVVRECEAGLKGVNIGIFTLNCMHTSAGLTVSCSARRFGSRGNHRRLLTDFWPGNAPGSAICYRCAQLAAPCFS